jgi:hypothetical protein
MTEKSLPVGGGWAAQQKEGMEKQAHLAKQKRAANPPGQNEVVDQEALVAGAMEQSSHPEGWKEQSATPKN